MTLKNDLLWHSNKGALKLSKKSKNVLLSIKGHCGIYFLSDSIYGEVLYVGRSKDLMERIPKSMSERSLKYFDFVVTDSLADSHLLEVYYICSMKPLYNKMSNDNDEVDTGFKIPNKYKRIIDFRCAGEYINWEERKSILEERI